jgi:hypothetical protein
LIKRPTHRVAQRISATYLCNEIAILWRNFWNRNNKIVPLAEITNIVLMASTIKINLDSMFGVFKTNDRACSQWDTKIHEKIIG